MKVLVVGSGGREHALAWRLSLADSVDAVFAAPGNPGTAAEKGITNVAVTDIAELTAFAKKEGIDLTVVGPEAPLAKGLVNVFRAEGLAVFGPTKEAAQLESSKDFAKVLKAACDGKLNEAELTWDNRSALGVVIAARGYPEHPEKGAVITDLPCNDADHHLFHAGTAKNAKGELVVAGGRVLCAVGLGDTLHKAHDAAYEAAREVRFDGMQMRSDIGFRALGK